MKTLIHSKTRVARQPRGSIKHVLIAAGLATAVAAPAWGTEQPDVVVNVSAADTAARDPAINRAVDSESVARANWRKLMARNSTPAVGCFHASYPSIVWETVQCRVGQPRVHSVHVERTDDSPDVTGNGNDYVAKATGLITEAIGEFVTKGVISEVGVGVAQYQYKGILGPNEYSIQLNTNKLLTTSACAGHSGCQVAQQFIYGTDYFGPGEAAVYMEYWLEGWGPNCPGGWTQSGNSCYENSPLTPAPDVEIAGLHSMSIGGSATAGGNDTVVFLYDSETWSTTYPDSVLDISSVWNKTEVNVVGDSGGSRANFNSGSSITTYIYLFDGSNSAPTCVANDGTTGETNNLNLGTCTAASRDGFLPPSITFTESN